MPTKLSGQMQSSPLVQLYDKIGTAGRMFIGVLSSGPRVVKMKRGSREVYEFKILDTNAPIQKKVGEDYVSADVEQGDTVAIFCPTALAGALKGAKMGQIIRIVGLGKKSNKEGTEFHAFDVEVLTQEEFDALS